MKLQRLGMSDMAIRTRHATRRWRPGSFQIERRLHGRRLA